MDSSPTFAPSAPGIVCFSHLRWDFVYQRPQHLMSRFARVRRVLYIEEPVWESVPQASLRITTREGGVSVAVPVLPIGLDERAAISVQRELFTEHIPRVSGGAPTFWFQTPMALPTAPIELAGLVIYDCMDELSAFDGAPPALAFNEKQLLARADLLFTGGHSLYEAKKLKHPNVHCFPSGIDADHFRMGRVQRHGTEYDGRPSSPTVGFCGVIDERLNVALLASIADARPDYQFVMVGPVVKIDPDSLPRRDNIHYLGFRDYSVLPAVMSEWDAAMMPFARNAATKYISPTKTPEYLAAGLPVVCTSIRDVVRGYGDAGIVAIADDAEEFALALDRALTTRHDESRLAAVDSVLADASWDSVWARMATLEQAAAVAAVGPLDDDDHAADAW